ncbi:fimbrillin family protein [Streptomyces sp. NPDC091377]|uniref:fimbrillin family protein n=1 Tax=Streptomyces sp. NPDC091377 TaxID=3365995 RepID=UPI003803187E
MPLPLSPRARSGPRRRTLLASAAGTLLLTGCTSDDGSEGATGGSPAAVQRVRARAVVDSRALVERYDAVLAAHPALGERLRPLREATVRHAKAFGATGKGAGGSSASPSASGAPSVDVPRDEKGALAALASAERALADRRAAALLELPGELARLLASVAAAGAAHAFLLTEGQA